jgi:hypothetical protein
MIDIFHIAYESHLIVTNMAHVNLDEDMTASFPNNDSNRFSCEVLSQKDLESLTDIVCRILQIFN